MPINTMTPLLEPWQPPAWEDVYSEDATDALLDLCDAVDDNPAGIDLQAYRHRLAVAAKGKWAMVAVLTQPVLIELCNDVAVNEDFSLETYKARLAAVAGRLREPMTVSAQALSMLTPDELSYLLGMHPELRIV